MPSIRWGRAFAAQANEKAASLPRAMDKQLVLVFACPGQAKSCQASVGAVLSLPRAMQKQHSGDSDFAAQGNGKAAGPSFGLPRASTNCQASVGAVISLPRAMKKQPSQSNGRLARAFHGVLGS